MRKGSTRNYDQPTDSLTMLVRIRMITIDGGSRILTMLIIAAFSSRIGKLGSGIVPVAPKRIVGAVLADSLPSRREGAQVVVVEACGFRPHPFVEVDYGKYPKDEWLAFIKRVACFL